MWNKKRFRLLLVFIMMLSFVACGGKAMEKDEREEKSQKTLYEHGLEIIELMVEATRNETYMEIYTASEEMAEIIIEIGEGDFEEPDKVLALTGDTEVFAELLGVDEVEGLSRDLEKNLNNRMFGAIITQLNSRAGSMYLAATSICTMGKTFVNEDVEENVIYFYIYEDATPIAVTFIPGEDGAVGASGCFIMGEDISTELEDMEEVFEEFGLDVEEVDFE